MMLVSVVIPLYNERNTIAELIRRVKSAPVDDDLVTRVLDDTTKPGIEAQSILVALDRCTIGVENQTRIRRFAVTPATADTFAQYWRSALFPDNVALHDDQRPLIEQARAAGMSVVTLAP